VEKVHRYEGPILAEREHVATLAQKARLRTRTGVSGGGSTPSLSARVSERLKARDVEVTNASWDSWRIEGGPWTVVLTFAAGGRQRQASWVFDLADRTVSAVDDEARWLSEEVPQAKGPIPAPRPRPVSGAETTVYDLEAEGGLRAPDSRERQEDPLDLMTAMRKRSTARGRRRPGTRSGSSESFKPTSSAPEAEKQPLEQALPLGDLLPDPEALPPAAEPEQAAPVNDLADEVFATGNTSPQSGRESDGPAQTPAGPQPRSRSKRPARETARKTGRPSVPAWDEIMFGSRPGVDRSSS
jgi:hypothetical protein